MANAIPTRLSAAEGRKFALTLGLAFLAIAAFLWWRGRSTVAMAGFALGVLFLAAALLIPARLGPVYRAWMAFAELLSKITTPVFMGVVYFLLLTPFGIVRRALGHSPIHRRRAPSESVWHERNPAQPSNLRRQF